MLIAFSISPSGGDETGGVSAAVAEAVKVVRDSGLPCETNAMFTNIEGEWDEVMALVRACTMKVAESAPRVSVGGYTSVQVNVDGLGRNIVGDAANEPSIAMNLLDPARMVIGWQFIPMPPWTTPRSRSAHS